MCVAVDYAGIKLLVPNLSSRLVIPNSWLYFAGGKGLISLMALRGHILSARRGGQNFAGNIIYKPLLTFLVLSWHWGLLRQVFTFIGSPTTHKQDLNIIIFKWILMEFSKTKVYWDITCIHTYKCTKTYGTVRWIHLKVLWSFPWLDGEWNGRWLISYKSNHLSCLNVVKWPIFLEYEGEKIEGILITWGTSSFRKDSGDMLKECLLIVSETLLSVNVHICQSGKKKKMRTDWCFSRGKSNSCSCMVICVTKLCS